MTFRSKVIELWRAAVVAPGGVIAHQPAAHDREVAEDLGGDICSALGIDPTNVARVEIDLRPGDVSTVKVTTKVTSKAGELIGRYIKSYALTERGPRANR